MPISFNAPTLSEVLTDKVGNFSFNTASNIASNFVDKFNKLSGLGNLITDSFSSLKNSVGSADGKKYVDNLYSGDLDYQRAIEQVEAQRRFSSSEAQKLRDWQEYMSNTAYSRAVKDLKSVGINPYAIGGFNSASTPSGAYGQSTSATGYGNLMSNSTGALTSIASSAISAIAFLATKGKTKFF